MKRSTSVRASSVTEVLLFIYRASAPPRRGNGSVIETVIVTTDKNGKVSIDAIGEGRYYLKETVAPVGYEIIKPRTGTSRPYNQTYKKYCEVI